MSKEKTAVGESLAAYIPIDRCHALARGEVLPDRTQGAGLFADISGFTPLTEALVRELGPQRGAEAITQQMNLVYEALIAEVDRYGGSVIGFAGDAITCWFDGDSGWRATTCALEMQHAMTSIATVELSSGSLTLALKIAVTAGPARRFAVGDLSIQLHDILAGATIARLAGGEQLADPGDVLVSEEVVQALKIAGRVKWRSNTATGGRYAVVNHLEQSAAATPWPALPPDSLQDSQARRWMLPPVYARLQAARHIFLAELRPCVALFIRFGGIQYDDDPRAGSKLDMYIRWVQRVLARHEGFLIDITIGDKGSFLYSAFGAPIAHDDDAVRAVAAALELRTPPGGGQFITSVQLGLSQGRMWAGPYGGPTRRTYGVLGDEVNLAARLMMKAAPGQVLLSPHLAAAVAHEYQLVMLEPVQIKGKQQPLALARVLSRRDTPTLSTLKTLPLLIGRNQELAHLQQIAAEAIGGAGRVVQIEGTAGIGKSHLARAVATFGAEQGVTVAIAECQSVSRATAYEPWRRICLRLLDIQPAQEETGAILETVLNSLNPDWEVRLPLLGDLLDIGIADNATTAALEPRLRQEALNTLVVDLLRALRRPLLLLIDDAHWMDEPSRRLTQVLAHGIAELPVLLLLTQRPALNDDDEVPLLPNHLRSTTRLVLGELGRDAVDTLLRHHFPGELDPLVVELVEALTQGNPYFVEELARSLKEQFVLVEGPAGMWQLASQTLAELKRAGSVVWDTSRAGWAMAVGARLATFNLGLPDSIHKVVLARMDNLPENPKLTLKVASVIGRIFEREHLRQTHPLGLDEAILEDELALLHMRDFTCSLSPPPNAIDSFQHSIAQEVAYETLLEAQRSELHHMAATALEERDPAAVETLAYHYQRSGERTKALEYVSRAAQKAQRAYANETALAYYDEALRLQNDWRWHLGRAEVLHMLGRRDEERAALESLAIFAEAPPVTVASLWSRYYETVGDYDAADLAAQQALQLCRAENDVIAQGRFLAQRGLIARRQGNYVGARAWYEEACALLGSDMPTEAEASNVLAEALDGLATVLRHLGDFEEARICYERALGLNVLAGNRKGEADVLNNLGVLADTLQDSNEALVYYTESLALRRSIGHRSGEGGTLLNVAIVIRAKGDYAQADEYLRLALGIQQAAGNLWEEINLWNELGIQHQELGDLAQAEQCLQRGLHLSREIGDEAGEAFLLSNLGLVLRDAGDFEHAATVLQEGLALARAQNDPAQVAVFLSYLGDVMLQAGRFEQALEHGTTALSLRRQLDLRLLTTMDLSTLAGAHIKLEALDEALSEAREAFAILQECRGEGPETPQRDYYLCYEVFAAANHESAATALRSAYLLVQRRADTISDPELRRSFLERVPINRRIVGAAQRNGIIV